MKKALIITYYWPPTGGSGVQRWVKFTKYLSMFGWESIVYTPKNPEQASVDATLLEDIPAGVTVIKRPIWEPYDAYRKLFGHKGKAAGAEPLAAGGKSFKQRLALALRGNLFVPDPRASWIRPSVKFLSDYLKEHPVDVIVTSGPPHSMHLIGLRLHRQTGIRWISDFRDPWTKMYYFKNLRLLPLAQAAHRRLEQQVLDESDAVIAVTPFVKEDFSRQTSTPVEVVTNGYDPADFEGPAPELPRSSFTIVHTGIMAADGNPLCLWEALSRMCAADPEFSRQLRIRLSGKTDPSVFEALRSLGLEGKTENLGYLSHPSTIQEQRGASVLIMPLREDPEMLKCLPGKIFEYLAARRPVLGIGQREGISARVLEECEAGVVLDWEEGAAMQDFISQCWRRHLDGTEGPTTGDISQYSRIELTRKLSTIL